MELFEIPSAVTDATVWNTHHAARDASSRATRTMLFKLLDYCVEIRIACTELPCEPVPSPLGNSFAVREHFELTGLTGRNDGINS